MSLLSFPLVVLPVSRHTLSLFPFRPLSAPPNPLNRFHSMGLNPVQRMDPAHWRGGVVPRPVFRLAVVAALAWNE